MENRKFSPYEAGSKAASCPSTSESGLCGKSVADYMSLDSGPTCIIVQFPASFYLLFTLVSESV